METYSHTSGYTFLPALRNDMVEEIVPLPIEHFYALRTSSYSTLFIRFDPCRDKHPLILTSPFNTLYKSTPSTFGKFKPQEEMSAFSRCTLYNFDFFGNVPGTNVFYGVVLVDNAPSQVCIVKFEIIIGHSEINKASETGSLKCDMVCCAELCTDDMEYIGTTLFNKKSGSNCGYEKIFTNVKAKINFVLNGETQRQELRGRFVVTLQEKMILFSLAINDNGAGIVHNAYTLDYFGGPIGSIMFTGETGLIASDETGACYCFDFASLITQDTPLYISMVRVPETPAESDAICVMGYGALLPLRKSITAGKYMYSLSGGSGFVAFDGDGVTKLTNPDIRGSLLPPELSLTPEAEKNRNSIFNSPPFFDIQEASPLNTGVMVDTVLDLITDQERSSLVVVGANKTGRVSLYGVQLNDTGEPVTGVFTPILLASATDLPSQEERKEIEKLQARLEKRKARLARRANGDNENELTSNSSSNCSLSSLVDKNNSDNLKEDGQAEEEEIFEGKPISRLNEFEKMQYEDSLILNVTARKPTAVYVTSTILYAVTDEGAFVWWIRDQQLRQSRLRLGLDQPTKPKTNIIRRGKASGRSTGRFSK